MPTHNLVKLRQVYLLKQKLEIFQRAKEAIRKVQAKLKGSGSGNAKAGLGYGHVYEKPITNHRAPQASIKTNCSVCHEHNVASFWYCIDCEGAHSYLDQMPLFAVKLTFKIDDVFICSECDAKGGSSFGTHKKEHALVHCTKAAGSRKSSLDKIDVPFIGTSAHLEVRIHEMIEKQTVIQEQMQLIMQRQAQFEESIRVISERQSQQDLAMGSMLRYIEGYATAMDERQSRMEDLMKALLARAA